LFVLLHRIALAETVWEQELHRDIFKYDPNATFKINLIYDERQLATIQKQKTEFGLSSAEQVLADLDNRFQLMKTNYELELARHQNRTVTFDSAENNYKKQVAYWNARGGAPKGDYEKLTNQAEYLNQEAESLNQETTTLNNLAKELNALLERRNQSAREYNQIARNYNQKYGHGVEFNQAEYTGQAINVYQFSDKQDLEVALAHEFGHALGMEHTENEKSIMYYISGGSAHLDLKPSTEDLVELHRVCR
jgi:hypothetical protein